MKATLFAVLTTSCLFCAPLLLAADKCDVINRRQSQTIVDGTLKVSLIYQVYMSDKSEVSSCVGVVYASELCVLNQVPHEAEIVVYSVKEGWENKRIVRTGHCIESAEKKVYSNGNFVPKFEFKLDGYWELIETLR